MRAGKLRHRIVIQEQKVVQNATTGEETKTWVDCFNVAASIEPLSTREFIAAQAQQSEVTGRVVIRYQDGITSDMRIVYRDKTYRIHGVQADVKSGLEYLTLPVSEGVSNVR